VDERLIIKLDQKKQSMAESEILALLLAQEALTQVLAFADTIQLVLLPTFLLALGIANPYVDPRCETRGALLQSRHARHAAVAALLTP